MKKYLKEMIKKAEEKEGENWEFRKYLKFYDVSEDKIDKIVYDLYQQISKEIDCTACTN